MIINPTIEQRRTIKNIIYLIVNLTNFRCYVGLTVQTFAGRYRTTRWWNKLDNKELKSDILKLGIENFQIILLEQNITDIIELNNLEHLYATVYDCYYPHGYNIAICGRKEDYRDSIIKGRIKCREANRKYPLKDKYEFIDPSNNKIIVNDIIKFGEEIGISYHNLLRIDRGECKYYNGYCSPKNPLKTYRFVSPNEIIYEVREDEMGDFSREHKINGDFLTYLTRRDCKIYNGWRLLENKHIKQIKKIFTLKSPLNILYYVEDIIEFCNKNKFDYSHMRKLLKGKRKQCRSWTLPETDLKIYWLLNSNNKPFRIVEGWEVYNFCKENHLNIVKLNKLSEGKIKEYNGWTLGKEPIDYQI